MAALPATSTVTAIRLLHGTCAGLLGSTPHEVSAPVNVNVAPKLRRAVATRALALSPESLDRNMGPPLCPTQAGFALLAVRPTVQIELYLDLICPFSQKMFCTLYDEVMPGLDESMKKDVSFVIQQVPQPWHPQGTYVHEAALAVKACAPDAYPSYVRAIYEAFGSGKFKDDDTIDKSRKQIYSELLDLLALFVGQTVRPLVAPARTGRRQRLARLGEIARRMCCTDRDHRALASPAGFRDL